MTHNKRADITTKQILELRREGYTMEAIAKTLNCGSTLLYRRLEGVDYNKAGIPHLARVVSTISMEQRMQDLQARRQQFQDFVLDVLEGRFE